jgi:hypothetical protein
MGIYLIVFLFRRGKMVRFLGCILLILLFDGTNTAYSEEGGGSLGMRVGEVTDVISRAFGLTEPHGAIVYSVDETGPASSAHIQPGDLVTKLNNRNVREYREFSELVKQAPQGAQLNLTIVHLGQEQIKTVTKGAPAPSIRTPGCEEISISDSPMTSQIFGKPPRDMTLAELEQAHAIAAHCLEFARTAYARHPSRDTSRMGRNMPASVAWIRSELNNAKQARLDEEKRALARDQVIFQSRLEEERKNQTQKPRSPQGP